MKCPNCGGEEFTLQEKDKMKILQCTYCQNAIPLSQEQQQNYQPPYTPVVVNVNTSKPDQTIPNTVSNGTTHIFKKECSICNSKRKRSFLSKIFGSPKSWYLCNNCGNEYCNKCKQSKGTFRKKKICLDCDSVLDRIKY